jgi:hypothetical protein
MPNLIAEFLPESSAMKNRVKRKATAVGTPTVCGIIVQYFEVNSRLNRRVLSIRCAIQQTTSRVAPTGSPRTRATLLVRLRDLENQEETFAPWQWLVKFQIAFSLPFPIFERS